MARLSEEEREEARENWQEHGEDRQEDRQDFVDDQLDEHGDDDDWREDGWLRPRRSGPADECLLPVSGLLAMVFGLWLLVSPGEGALAVVRLIGVYAIVQGAVLIGVGFRLKGLYERLEWARLRHPA